jgi:hypothetical protein
MEAPDACQPAWAKPCQSYLHHPGMRAPGIAQAHSRRRNSMAGRKGRYDHGDGVYWRTRREYIHQRVLTSSNKFGKQGV